MNARMSEEDWSARLAFGGRLAAPLAGKMGKGVSLVFAGLMLAGCSSQTGINVPPEVVAGLDPQVVREVLTNPGAVETIELAPGDEYRHGYIQGITINFIVCRDALRVLETWRSTGQRADLAPLPVPDYPVETAYKAWQENYAVLQGTLASGEIDRLVKWIADPAGCGSTVPAQPGELSGPTVAERARASG